MFTSLHVVPYRNFNLCPHCERLGMDPLLLRLAEGLPMISRSDGVNFHLLLADRPLPYPAERSAQPAREVSLCFWYSSDTQRSTLVIVPAGKGASVVPYRDIEFVADLLSEKLLLKGKLAPMYGLTDNSLRLWNY